MLEIEKTEFTNSAVALIEMLEYLEYEGNKESVINRLIEIKNEYLDAEKKYNEELEEMINEQLKNRINKTTRKHMEKS